ncbi:MAG: DUF4843 domain-containing protein [Bacteroidaceae bacterium]|nr:DUF4843 domain-containing protein [Bacteroidaceae bacterium]
MNKIKLISSIALLSAVLTSCERELMTYEGKDSLYFDIRNEVAWLDPDTWSHEYYSTVSFGSTMDDEISKTFKVQASGMPSSVDREFRVVVVADSTELLEGDFTGLAESYCIKAGETSTTVDLTFKRGAHMKNDTLQLQLALVANEHFSLMFDEIGRAPEQYTPDANVKFDYNHNASIHNIFVYDVMSKPKQWAGLESTGMGSLGGFSAKKWLLIMKLTGTTIEDFADASTMPSVRMAAIGETLAIFLLEKARAKTPVLDEDGSMMYCNAVSNLGGSDKWAPFTKPEKYYGSAEGEGWRPFTEE